MNLQFLPPQAGEYFKKNISFFLFFNYKSSLTAQNFAIFTGLFRWNISIFYVYKKIEFKHVKLRLIWGEIFQKKILRPKNSLDLEFQNHMNPGFKKRFSITKYWYWSMHFLILTFQDNYDACPSQINTILKNMYLIIDVLCILYLRFCEKHAPVHTQ